MKRKNSQIGSALITALVSIVFLLTLAMARLFSVEQDYLAAGHAATQMQAYYLAKSGLHYYMNTKTQDTGSPKTPQKNTNSESFLSGEIVLTRTVPEGDTKHFFDLSVDRNGDIRSRGYILNEYYQVISQKVLIMPPEPGQNVYDATE